MTGRDPYEVAAERVAARKRKSLVDEWAAALYVDCETHGRQPVDPFHDRCLYCQIERERNRHRWRVVRGGSSR